LLDKGYLTEIRTALVGALAAENLANPEIKTVSIIKPECRIRRLRFIRLNKRLGWNWEVFLRSDF